MASLVTKEHWEFWLGNMPMPEGATTEMMWAARDALDKIEDREEDLKMITWYRESQEAYLEKRKFWVANKKDEPDYAEKLALYDSILGTIQEGIDFLMERLNND